MTAGPEEPGATERLLAQVAAELAELRRNLRQGRAAVQAVDTDRLRDSHARLHEISATSESATLRLLDGLDRTLAHIDALERGDAGPDAFDHLRGEVNSLYECLQFQDIIAQQLAGVTALLADLEARVADVSGLIAAGAPGAPAPDSYNPDATIHDVASRQAQVDLAFASARQVPPG